MGNMFTVSARNAILANQAKAWLAAHEDGLQQLDEEPWFEDFARAACGTTWRRQYERERAANNRAWLKELSDSLWEESNWNAVLKEMLTTCFNKAAPGALLKAAINAQHSAQEASELVNLYVESNRLDEASLQRHISDHEQRTEDLRLHMEVMHAKKADILSRALEKVQLVLERSQSNTLSRILEVREKQDIDSFWRHCGVMGCSPLDP